MAKQGRLGITRRTALTGTAVSAAATIPGGLLTAAVAGTFEPQTLDQLVVAIDDVPTDEFEWGSLKWLVNAARSPGAEQTVGICQILPGKGNPVHYHPNCEEVLYMIAGRGRHSFGEEAVELTPGMTIRIPENVRHNLVNTGWQTIICLVTFSSGDRQTVFVE